MSLTLTVEQSKALAERIRITRRVDTSLCRIGWHSSGSAAGHPPGTVFKARITLKEGEIIFLLYLPSPRNSRVTAKAVLGRHLAGETLGIPGAVVTRK